MQTESHTSRLENIAPLENVELIARTSATLSSQFCHNPNTNDHASDPIDPAHLPEDETECDVDLDNQTPGLRTTTDWNRHRQPADAPELHLD